MERDPARQPRSTTGDLVFPIPTRPRELVEGDLLWVDNGINFGGYQSDYGNAWIVGRARTIASASTMRCGVRCSNACWRPCAPARPAPT